MTSFISKIKNFNFGLLSRILGLTKPYRLFFYLSITIGLVIAPIAAYRPYLIKTIIDDNIKIADSQGVINNSVLFIGLLILETILSFAFGYLTFWLGQSIIKDLRNSLFNHIIRLELTYFDKTPIGNSTTRTISDIETINAVFSEGIITIFIDIITLLIVFGMMLFANWKLTLVCISVLPLLILASYYFKEAVKKSFTEVRSQIAIMNSFLQERIAGMKIIQIFNLQSIEKEKLIKINKDYTDANIKSIFAYSVFFPAVEIISAISIGLLVWYGSFGILKNQITIGVLISFPLYINMLFRPIRMLADKFNTLQMGMIAAERVFNLQDTELVNISKGKIKIPDIKGNIVYQNVCFSYNPPQLVLDNINIKANENETIAIVGSTGSGKTSIISILSRFYPIQSGKITIDGYDINDLDLNYLRTIVGVILQDVFLFNGTIMENITLKNDMIEKEKVYDFAKKIGCYDLIMKLPNGFDFNVMERGVALSVGQKQLISMLRTLIYNPKIIIMDEATSSIDPESEKIIQYAIEKLIEKRTSIIIAHRLSTIRHANKIYVIEHGKVLEEGTHQELIEKENGRFRNLYNKQVTTVALS